MDTPPTILDLKFAFISEQIQILSKPLRVPTSYQPLNQESKLREKSINTALARVNDLVRKHSKLVYSAQARRHVAEQIDTLYWQAGKADIVTGNWEGLQLGDDLTTPDSIARLPETWDTENDEGKLASFPDSENQSEYSELAAKVKDLDARRQYLLRNVAEYKALKELLAPFENAIEMVQQNLVLKNGELEKELERMRLLINRVAGRVERLPASGKGEKQDQELNEVMEVDLVEEEAKIQGFLSGL